MTTVVITCRNIVDKSKEGTYQLLSSGNEGVSSTGVKTQLMDVSMDFFPGFEVIDLLNRV